MSTFDTNNKISRIPPSKEPLSADVIFIKDSDFTWIFDVGRTDEALRKINAIPGPRAFVISHFHGDHMENMGRLTLLPEDKVYCGGLTAKKLSGILPAERLIVVTEAVTIGCVTIFPIPSSHEKGCLALAAFDTAFLGDATYSFRKDGHVCYNTSLLSQTIKVLKERPEPYLYLSHNDSNPQDKSSQVRMLEYIYSHRAPGEAYIYCDCFN